MELPVFKQSRDLDTRDYLNTHLLAESYGLGVGCDRIMIGYGYSPKLCLFG